MESIKAFLAVSENWVVVGVMAFIITRWFLQKESKEHGSKKTWSSWVSNELNDWVITIMGAFIFYFAGDSMLTAACYPVGIIWNYDACISTYIAADEMFFLVGGALFGTSFPWGYRLWKKYKLKKLKK